MFFSTEEWNLIDHVSQMSHIFSADLKESILPRGLMFFFLNVIRLLIEIMVQYQAKSNNGYVMTICPDPFLNLTITE